MTDFEDRLRDALRRLPGPDEATTERVRKRALAAARQPERRSRRLGLALVAAAGAVLLTGTGLAATGQLEVRFGGDETRQAGALAPPLREGEIRLPGRVRGLAIAAGGRIWLRTRTGLVAQGLTGSTVELSPNASFAVAGIGRSLLALAPEGRRAWSQPTAGPVVAAAWAPNPIVIAYVVRRGERHELRLIEGDGDNDEVIDPDVSPVRPSWRADTRRLAYVDGDGSVRVRAYPSGAPVSSMTAPGRRASALAFAPAGDRVAIAGETSRGVSVQLRGAGRPPVRLGFQGGDVLGLAWDSDDAILLAAGGRRETSWLWRLRAGGQIASKPENAVQTFGLSSLASRPGAATVAAVRAGEALELWLARGTPPGADISFEPHEIVSRLPAEPSAQVTISLR